MACKYIKVSFPSKNLKSSRSLVVNICCFNSVFILLLDCDIGVISFPTLYVHQGKSGLKQEMCQYIKGSKSEHLIWSVFCFL